MVTHIIATQRDLLVGHGHDLGAMPDLSDPAAGLRSHADRVLGLVSRAHVVDVTYEGFFGTTTVGATLVQFYVWDMLVHRWDIARAAGGDETLTPAELDRIEAGANSFGDALHMEGICGPAVPPPAGAGRQVELLSRLGRDRLGSERPALTFLAPSHARVMLLAPRPAPRQTHALRPRAAFVRSGA